MPQPVVAAVGVGATLLGVTMGVTFWPDDGAGRQTQASAGARAALATAGLTGSIADREAMRASRAGSRAALPASPSPTVPAVTGRLWVSTAVNVRSGPSSDDDRTGLLSALDRVAVTGVTWSGWTQVVVGKRIGWVRSTYLSKSKPEPEPAGISGAPCSISPSIETHLTSNARAVYRAVCAEFGGSVSSFGGYRPGDGGDHGSGRAVDIMVSGEPGSAIARYVQAHADELEVNYVIYEQKIWFAGSPTSQWKAMEDRGSTAANHFDHVHVSVE